MNKIILPLSIILFFIPNNILAQSQIDIQEILQKSIDFPQLRTYYHENLSGRKPLIIRNNEIPVEVNLFKFSEPVLFKTAEDIFVESIQAYLKIDLLEINDTSAKVILSYDIEGLRLSLVFQKENNHWIIKESDLSEK